MTKTEPNQAPITTSGRSSGASDWNMLRLRLLGLLLILGGIYTLVVAGNGIGQGHLPHRIEQATAPIIQEVLRTPRYVEEFGAFGRREKELKSLVDAVYVFAEEAEGRAFSMAMNILPIGIFEVVAGVTLLVIGFVRPKPESKR